MSASVAPFPTERSRESATPPAPTEAPAWSPIAPVPAIGLDGIWKLFGAPNKLRRALKAIAKAEQGDRASLKREFDIFAAVAGVTLQVRRYEILAIVGASGCGKSTLVRHMNGLIKPDRGQALVDGHAIDRLSLRELQNLRSTQVGMVFQNTSLFPHRTVLDNVVFGLEVRRVPRQQRYAIAREWLERVELGAWEQHRPSELSGGMQQRVGLARTFATDPETLLLDEPFSALDPIIRRSLQEQFVSLVRTYRKTAVFITHDFAEAVRIADRISVMADGVIVQTGTPRDIIMRPASVYVASFATPELKRSLVTAADIAAPLAIRPSRPTLCLAATATLAETTARLQAEDASFQIIDDSGAPIGWIDRSVLLNFLGKALAAET